MSWRKSVQQEEQVQRPEGQKGVASGSTRKRSRWDGEEGVQDEFQG